MKFDFTQHVANIGKMFECLDSCTDSYLKDVSDTMDVLELTKEHLFRAVTEKALSEYDFTLVDIMRADACNYFKENGWYKSYLQDIAERCNGACITNKLIELIVDNNISALEEFINDNKEVFPNVDIDVKDIVDVSSQQVLDMLIEKKVINPTEVIMLLAGKPCERRTSDNSGNSVVNSKLKDKVDVSVKDSDDKSFSKLNNKGIRDSFKDVQSNLYNVITAIGDIKLDEDLNYLAQLVGILSDMEATRKVLFRDAVTYAANKRDEGRFLRAMEMVAYPLFRENTWYESLFARLKD